MKRYIRPIVMATLLTTCSATAFVADYDISNNDALPPTVTISADSFIFQGGGAKGTGNDGAGISITAGKQLTIGRSSGAAGQGFSLTTGDIVTVDGTSKLVITSAVTANAEHGYDVVVASGHLDMATGGNVSLAAGAQGKVDFSIGQLTANNGAVVTVGNRARLTVTKSDGTNINGGTLKLAGGNAAFAKSLTIDSGSVQAEKNGILAIGEGLSINNNANAGNASIKVTGGAVLTINKDASGGSALGDMKVGNSLNAPGTGGGTIDIQGGGMINIGTLTLENGALLADAAANSGSINAESLVIANTGATEATAFVDSAKINTIVSGMTTVNAGARYTVAGTGNQYKGGMTLKGVLNHKDAASISFGNANSRATLKVDGGTIETAATQVFTIQYADIQIVGAGTNALNTGLGGELKLNTSSITVDITGGGNTIAVGGAITAQSYGQIAGEMTVNASGSNKLTITGMAMIGNPDATTPIQFNTGSNAVVFQRGLRLGAMGVIASTAGKVGTINFGIAGSTSASAHIEMTGKGKLVGGAAAGDALVLKDLSGLKAAQLAATGVGNAASGKIDASDFDLIINANDASAPALMVFDSGNGGMDVKSVTVRKGELAIGGESAGNLTSKGNATVYSGGVLSSAFAGSRLVDSIGTNVLRIESGGTLNTSKASLTVEGFKSIVLEGTFIAGWDGSAVTGLRADKDITIGASSILTMTTDLAMDAAINTVLIETTGGSIIANGAMQWSSMFGTFTYGLSADGKKLILASAVDRVTGDTPAGRRAALNNLQRIWGKEQIDARLGNIIFDASVTPSKITVNPAGSRAGSKNMEIFKSFAVTTGKNVTRNTLEYINGASLYGVTDVAMETNRALFFEIANRARLIHGQFTALRETMGSPDALASDVMNAEYANRIWGGGFGLWQNANTRQGFSGYKYDSWGTILGYDRCIGKGMAFGVSGAYNKGDYEDSGALAHGSTIESYSAGVYGTYSTCAGIFGTLSLGYTYSDNAMHELRNDPSVGASSWGDAKFHTNTWSMGGNVGWDIRPIANLTVTPATGLNYIRARNSDHNSMLGDVATQRITNAKNSGLFLPVEVTLRYDLKAGDEGMLRFEAGGGYAYNFKKSGLDGEIDYFDLSGPSGSVRAGVLSRDNSRHSYKVGVGVRYTASNSEVGIRYDYLGKSGSNGHRIMGTLGYAF